MIMDFEEDFEDLLEEWTLTVHTAQVDSPDGEALPGVGTSGPIMAMAPQPLSARELIKNERGEIVKDIEKTYTSVVVNTRVGDVQADWLTYNGTAYEVFKIEDRTSLGNFRKVYIRKIQGDR